MSASSSKEAAKRLLKCFCGCKEMTAEEVQRIYQLSPQSTLIDRQASLLLRRFLEQRQDGVKTETHQLLDVYEQCGLYMLKEASIPTLDELDVLVDKGLPYHMEKKLKIAIQSGDRSKIERTLFRIQGECRNEIEISEEYKLYKQAILDKLKQRV